MNRSLRAFAPVFASIVCACSSQTGDRRLTPHIVSIDAHAVDAIAQVRAAAAAGADGVDIWFHSDSGWEAPWCEAYERVSQFAFNAGFRSGDGARTTSYWHIARDRRFRDRAEVFHWVGEPEPVRDFLYTLMVRGIPFSVSVGNSYSVAVPARFESELVAKANELNPDWAPRVEYPVLTGVEPVVWESEDFVTLKDVRLLCDSGAVVIHFDSGSLRLEGVDYIVPIFRWIHDCWQLRVRDRDPEEREEFRHRYVLEILDSDSVLGITYVRNYEVR